MYQLICYCRINVRTVLEMRNEIFTFSIFFFSCRTFSKSAELNIISKKNYVFRAGMDLRTSLRDKSNTYDYLRRLYSYQKIV